MKFFAWFIQMVSVKHVMPSLEKSAVGRGRMIRVSALMSSHPNESIAVNVTM